MVPEHRIGNDYVDRNLSHHIERVLQPACNMHVKVRDYFLRDVDKETLIAEEKEDGESLCGVDKCSGSTQLYQVCSTPSR